MRITVVGTGYVGLVTGACLADMGNEVVGYDTDAEKIAKLMAQQMPIFEPGLAELVGRHQPSGRLRFTTDLTEALRQAELCFIAVGTPPDDDGSADRRHVLAAAKSIAGAMAGPLTIVVKSTVPVGTCQRVQEAVAEQLQRRHVSWPFQVAANPEFLQEGRAIDDFMRPDRIVVGVNDPQATHVLQQLYAPFVKNGHPLLVMDVASAEMSKYAANAMLATRISLINELAQVCERVGADIEQVRRSVGTDQRIGMSFLYAGVGYGGSCLPKDVKALSCMAQAASCPGDILAAVERVNHHQRGVLAERVMAHFGGKLAGRRLGVWGLAFKPMTDDVREAPALDIIQRLLAAGAQVAAYDPEAMPNASRALGKSAALEFVDDPYAAAANAEALILVTEWGVFRSPDFARLKAIMKQPVVFDGRNQYDPQTMRERGFVYTCIGRPTS